MNPNWGNRFSICSACLLALMWLVSLALPAYLPNSLRPEVVSGAEALLAGTFALLILCPAVLANPVTFLGIHFLQTRQWKKALLAGGLSFLLAGSTLLVYNPTPAETTMGSLHGGFPGILAPCITELRAGFFVWLGCPLLLMAAGIAGHFFAGSKPD